MGKFKSQQSLFTRCALKIALIGKKRAKKTDSEKVSFNVKETAVASAPLNKNRRRQTRADAVAHTRGSINEENKFILNFMRLRSLNAERIKLKASIMTITRA